MVPNTGFIGKGHHWNVRIPNSTGFGVALDRKRLESCAEIHRKGVNMALNLSQKQVVVAELADVASKAQSLVAAEYAGVTVSQMTSMRKKARENGVYLKVVKNTLATRAVDGTEFDVIKDDLVGPLLYAFSMEDPGAAARLIKEYAKTNDKLQAKVVSIGGQKYPASHVEVLASLPTRDQALSMLLSVLVEPATRVARALKAIGEKDTVEAPAAEAEVSA
jgi:large subunit ribosomal protein L10